MVCLEHPKFRTTRPKGPLGRGGSGVNTTSALKLSDVGSIPAGGQISRFPDTGTRMSGSSFRTLLTLTSRTGKPGPS